MAMALPTIGNVLDRADPIERTLTEQKAARRVIRCVQDGFGHPDAFLHALQDAAEADGARIAATAGVRALMREFQKHAESAPRT